MFKPLLLTLIVATSLSRAQAPAAPVLAFPADKAKDISIYTSIKWKKVASATAYHLQVSADTAFALPFYNDSALTDTLAAMKRLADSTTYYWRVRAANAIGFGPYSKVRSFLTNPVLDAGPVVVSPESYSTDVPTATTLIWQAFPSAKTYWIQVSLASNFNPVLINDSAVADTVRKIDKLAMGTVYYWHVRAVNGATKSAWTKSQFATVEAVGVRAPVGKDGERSAFRVLPGRSGGRGASLEYVLEKPSIVGITVYGLRGEGARVVAAGAFAAGPQRAELAGLRSGVYLVSLRIDGTDRTQRVFIP